MLIETHDLSRRYGDMLAVDHLNFAVDRGEIVGLLGPNGAGKTTTMQMLCGFLPASGGTARVAGHDVRDESREVRRNVGYMPERYPLYPEMRVTEYMQFRAALKGVPRKYRTRSIDRALSLCTLHDVRRKLLGTLSMGYRQRVGLADALLAEPDVLILDEPTIGLDPNQVRQTRRTIRQLSEGRTVLLSTHVLAEVEALCERALIMQHGRIIADDTPENLSDAQQGRVTVVELRGDAEQQAAALRALEHVSSVRQETAEGCNRFLLNAEAGADVRESVSTLAAERGWPLRELSHSRTSLEDVFHRITRGAGAEERTNGVNT